MQPIYLNKTTVIPHMFHYWGVFFWREGRGGGGTPYMHGHKESYKELTFKKCTSAWDSSPRPHEY